MIVSKNRNWNQRFLKVVTGAFVCTIGSYSVAPVKAADGVEKSTSIIFYKGTQASIRLIEAKESSGVQNGTPESRKWKGVFECVIQGKKIPIQEATFEGTTELQTDSTPTETKLYAKTGNLTLLQDIDLAPTFKEGAKFTFAKGVSFNRSIDSPIIRLIDPQNEGLQQKIDGLSFKFGDGGTYAGKAYAGLFRFRAEQLTFGDNGFSGKLVPTNPSLVSSINIGNGFKLSVNKLTLDIVNNQLGKLDAVARFQSGTNSQPPAEELSAQRGLTSEARLTLYPGNYDGNMIQVKSQFGLSLPLPAANLQVQDCVVDLSKTDEIGLHPDYWTEDAAQWKGLYIQKANLTINTMGRGDAKENFQLSSTDLYWDKTGSTGKIKWVAPEISKGKFTFIIDPGELTFVQGKITQGSVHGKLTIDAEISGMPAGVQRQPLTVNWSTNLKEALPSVLFSTPASQEIRINKAGVKLAIASGEFSFVEKKLTINGSLNLPDVEILKSTTFHVKDFQISADGKVNIGTIAAAVTEENPVNVELGPCRWSIHALKFTQASGVLTTQIDGKVSLLPNLPLGLKIKSVDANGNSTETASLTLVFDGDKPTLTWKDSGIDIEAKHVLDTMSVNGELKFRNIKNSQLCLYGNVAVKFDGLVRGTNDIQESSADFQFLVTKEGWYLKGKYESNGQSGDSGIPLGDTGLRIYKMQGAVGQNVSLDSFKDVSTESGGELSVVQQSSPKAPSFVADVIVGTSDGTTFWGRGNLLVSSDRKLQIQGQFHLMEKPPLDSNVTPTPSFVKRIEKYSSPTDPRTASINIVWDDINKGLLAELDSNLILKWGKLNEEVELKTSGKARLFLSSEERSLRLGSVDSLDDEGVIVRCSDGSVFKSAFYVRMTPNWDIRQVEMGVLWNKDFPLYDNMANLNADVQGTLYYFSQPDDMRTEWKTALATATKKDIKEVNQVFVGKIAGRMTASVFIFNAQAKGQALAILTDRNLLLQSSAEASVGLVGINFPLVKSKNARKIQWGGKRLDNDADMERLRYSPRVDKVETTEWKADSGNAPTASILSISVSPQH